LFVGKEGDCCRLDQKRLGKKSRGKKRGNEPPDRGKKEMSQGFIGSEAFLPA
jgi:hypothetical protein